MKSWKRNRSGAAPIDNKDRVYHDVEIERLAKAFENQFFRVLSRKGKKLPPKPRDKYDAQKNLCFSELAKLQIIFCWWLLLTIVEMALLITNLVIYSNDPTGDK